MENFVVISLILLWLLVLFNLLITFALVRRVNNFKIFGGEDMDVSTLEPGVAAPDFVAENLQGEKVVLADYSNRNVAFIFMTSICEPCRKKLPDLAKLVPKAVKAGVQLTFVSLDDRDKTISFLGDAKSTLPVLIANGSENSFGDDYQVRGTPFYTMINKDGIVQSAGFLDGKWNQIVSEWS